MLPVVVKKIFQKSRLDEYRSILEYARDCKYVITSLKDWYEQKYYAGRKVFILRHDVDFDREGAHMMFQIEKELGVRSTFYYRWATLDESTMQEMHRNEFEVSLHYETLATYCRKKNIRSAELLSERDFEECLEKLIAEIRCFEERFWNVHTICSHGDRRNRLLGVPNHRILQSVDRQELGLYFEAYDQDVMSRIDCYISDGTIKENHAWRYGYSPFEAIQEGERVICLLTHPQHWNYNYRKNIRRLAADVGELLRP